MTRSTFLAALLIVYGAFGCKTRDTGSGLKGAVPLSLSPPKVLYHFGVYQHLRPYGKVPGDALAAKWNQIPSISNPPGGAYRKGFYLSQHPGYNEKYAVESLSSPAAGSPWLMTVTLRDECIDDGPTQRWFDFLNSEEFSDCDFGNGKTSPECLTRADDYLFSHNTGLVRDSWWPTKGFWYARDPKCLKVVDSTPESVLEAAASVPEFWSVAPYTTDERRDVGMGTSYRPGEVSFAVLTRALLDVAKPNKDLLKNIALSAKKSDIPGLKGPLATLTDYAYSCAVSNRGAEFKRELKVFTDKIDQEVLGKEGLSFDKHIQNLVGSGLPKLRGVCPAVTLSGTSGIASNGKVERENKQEGGTNGDSAENEEQSRPLGSCPAGYIAVPGDRVFLTTNFCVMKFEAKDGEDSHLTGKLWLKINQSDAKSQCKSIGKGYHLITNPEWMTIATNIAAQSDNWSGGAVGSGELNRGLSGNEVAPSSPKGPGWTIDRRTHTLSNGEVIWDLAGNAWEWVDYINLDNKIGAGSSWLDISTRVSGTSKMPLKFLRPSSSTHSFWRDSWGEKQGMGNYFPGENGSGGALLRGGSVGFGPTAGVFAATLGVVPSLANRDTGFRCAFSTAE